MHPSGRQLELVKRHPIYAPFGNRVPYQAIVTLVWLGYSELYKGIGTGLNATLQLNVAR